MQAIVLIGPQASGKSSFCKERLFNSHLRLNLDMLRTRHREALLLAACIAAKQPVVIDNTNPTAADRARYLGQFKAAGYAVHGYFFPDAFEVCQARNAQRLGKARIPDVGLKDFFARLERPTHQEGFDALFSVSLQNDEFVVEALSDAI
ncbi:AAA family ATPase [Chitinimonas sp. JJ19]|uniref:AAA family ATPase n=1 Tax=Chitinimonas sp. JJ19 TaxID=3109352 RepID=UPI0030017FAF